MDKVLDLLLSKSPSLRKKGVDMVNTTPRAEVEKLPWAEQPKRAIALKMITISHKCKTCGTENRTLKYFDIYIKYRLLGKKKVSFLYEPLTSLNKEVRILSLPREREHLVDWVEMCPACFDCFDPRQLNLLGETQ